jgi:UPF0716 protein FxsA
VLPVIIVLFVCVPILELWVIWQVGSAIGILPTLALLIVDSIIGGLLLRSQGRTAWRRFTESIGRARIPAREVLDGVLVVFGGALLLTPGFATDIFGFLLLVPPTRAVFRGLLVRHFAHRMMGAARFGPAMRARRGADDAGDAGDTGDAWDVEGTATETEPRTPLPRR